MKSFHKRKVVRERVLFGLAFQRCFCFLKRTKVKQMVELWTSAVNKSSFLVVQFSQPPPRSLAVKVFLLKITRNAIRYAYRFVSFPRLSPCRWRRLTLMPRSCQGPPHPRPAPAPRASASSAEVLRRHGQRKLRCSRASASSTAPQFVLIYLLRLRRLVGGGVALRAGGLRLAGALASRELVGDLWICVSSLHGFVDLDSQMDS